MIAYGAPASMLSQSALKIQARFRSHMERSYVARHEARLAALPLTSPSTPLRGAATPGESPLPKRQRVSASPLASKCAMLLEEEAEEAGLLDARELSFQSEAAEEAEESSIGVGVAVPIVTAAASATAAPSRIPSLLNTCLCCFFLFLFGSAPSDSCLSFRFHFPDNWSASMRRVNVSSELRADIGHDACWTPQPERYEVKRHQLCAHAFVLR